MINRRKLNIAIDIDGVLSNFVDTFILLVQEKYCYKLLPADIYVHDLFLVLGIPEEEAKGIIIEALYRPIKPMEGAVRVMQNITQNHDVFLITARPYSTAKITEDWLRTNNIPFHSLIFLNEGTKHLHASSFDIIIDDNLREVLAFHQKADCLVVFDHPWNQTKNVKNIIMRVTTWQDLENLIENASTVII